MNYVLDSNIISYFLRGEGEVNNYFQQEIIQTGNSYAIPLIVAYEVRRWLLDKPTKALKILNQQFDIMFDSVQDKSDMPVEVWDKAVEIYIGLKQRGQLIKDSDILIAAYCLVNDCTLVTRNRKDFERITAFTELKFVNWFE